ncbi:DegT/DnrJ/EryC1/StrS family aminotransferase [archaeon]|jgi:perosamine synthetase|nr:DegT/DnrJ/EryC1/StrS family aminotransferase [archaeon]MBT3451350.1 DegT/DnrJ/EryC1/StrS family aminotransferase [archaeon]MBT6869334.1 DegT/DnrJ/EryC1/StrS family aminotransferase [archaeon]MBT7507811.1 DegT/DnrJ/EryC1/StrS family aminotransferase [archaeon]
MEKLALLNGIALRQKPFPKHPMIGIEEKKAVLEVLESGKLSTFIAAPGKHFLGGEKIREFERIVAEYHNVEYAVAFNSATAALHAAVVACGVQPGEEVITTPYTFTSTATCALMANAIPVFADICDDDYNIDPEDILKKISPLSKVIIPVHLFGNSAKMNQIIKIAKENNLKVIEDCAQSPGALYQGRKVGTIGDCGILSFTENKNITSGEGGMLITDNEEIAHISRLVRNHGEAIIAGQPRSYNSSILGWNYRMTEVDAAIGIEQFKKLDYFNTERIKLSEYLTNKINEIPGLKILPLAERNKSVYYVLPIEYDEELIGIKRDLFVKALVAEGISFGAGYAKPLYYSPIYHENKPFIYNYYTGNANYAPGSCPIAEEKHFKKLIITILCRPPADFEDMNDIIKAIKKVIEHKEELNRNVNN